MTIRVKCPACQQTLKAEDRHAGRTVRCPACREPVTIPALVTAAPTPATTSDSIDPFAHVAEPANPPTESPSPPRPPKRRPKLAPPVSAAMSPAVDEDEIGDWLTEGLGSTPLQVTKTPVELPPQSPNWNGVSETYDVAAGDPVEDDDLAGLPPKIGKKKKKKVVDDEVAETRSRSWRPPVQSTGRPWLLWALAACLLPLAIGVALPDRSIEERLTEAFEQTPELAERFEALPETAEDPVGTLVSVFPDGKLPGAFLRRDTWWHFGLAAFSAIGFLGLILAAWPDEEVSPGFLVVMGILTGTLGIALLLGFQYMAEFTQHFNLSGHSFIVVLFYIVKFIGFSYRCAIDASIGFGLSFMGFTFGVGFCEELCKAVPIVLYLWSGQRTTWRGATVVGFASGIGFGVSEGVMYSAEMYNGLSTPMIYSIRFLSCVALHTIWAGSVGLLMFHDQSHLNDIEWEDIFLFIGKYLGIAMVLHGLYDVLLKFDYQLGALAVAAGSFAWLLYLVTCEQQDERLPA